MFGISNACSDRLCRQRPACVCPPAYMLVFVCLLVTVAVEWFHEADIEIFFSIGSLSCKWQRSCESVVTGTSGQDLCCLLGTLHLCCKFFFPPPRDSVVVIKDNEGV